MSFVLKVADLLRARWSHDTVPFANLMSNHIPQLTEKGMSGELYIQWLNDTTVLVELENVTCDLNEVCDFSETSFVRHVETWWQSARFVVHDGTQGEELDVYDDEFPINAKDETINLEDFIVQAIVLEQPAVIINPDYQKEYEQSLIDNIDDPDQIAYMEGTNNVTFS